MVRMLWLLGYLHANHTIDLATFQEITGCSHRTYYRALRTLREAGFDLESQRDNRSTVRLVAFDPYRYFLAP